ncbi:MAG: hypothetical protein WD335_01160 [Candidatus Paceibacterota bacterium]
MEKQKQQDLIEKLSKGTVEFYSYQDDSLPDIVTDNHGVSVFVNKEAAESIQVNKDLLRTYSDLSEIYRSTADICFLDGKAKRVLLAKFPDSCEYVLLRLSIDVDLLVALPGLLRRYMKGKVAVLGKLILDTKDGSQSWLVIKPRNKQGNSTGGFSISKEVGVQGLLEYLREERVNYVVLRFYDDLPNLHRDGGDMDLLVADEDKEKVAKFLVDNRGEIPVEIFSVSDPSYRGITYYPPPLAKEILDNSVDGPAKSRIPAPKEAFLSLAYHALYHKGFDAGIRSKISPDKVNKKPKNDYAAKLSVLASTSGVDIDITMEDLDEYLAEASWRPKLDTLAKISFKNKWVWERFFSDKKSEEIGLGVFIIKKKALKEDLHNEIVAAIEKENFLVLDQKKFNEDEKEHVTKHLRGGNWTQHKAGDDFLPAAAVVVLDPHGAHASFEYIEENTGSRMRTLKERIRNKFDDDEVSLVHSTDNTHESWEYIEICFSDKGLQEIKTKIGKVGEDYKVPLGKKIKMKLKLLPYLFRSIFVRLKSWVIKQLLN